ADREWTCNFVGRQLRNAAAFLQRRFEYVRELPANRLECFAISVTRDRGALKHVEAAEIVKSEDVIRVCMREQHCVNARESMLERLLPQIRRRVDENPCPLRHVDVNRRS